MIKPEVISKSDLEGGWLMEVELDSNRYQVGLSKDYYEKLKVGNESPERLVVRSFEFLLERESPEAIMTRFELRVIQQYFPEYEQLIKQDNA